MNDFSLAHVRLNCALSLALCCTIGKSSQSIHIAWLVMVSELVYRQQTIKHRSADPNNSVNLTRE